MKHITALNLANRAIISGVVTVTFVPNFLPMGILDGNDRHGFGC